MSSIKNFDISNMFGAKIGAKAKNSQKCVKFCPKTNFQRCFHWREVWASVPIDRERKNNKHNTNTINRNSGNHYKLLSPSQNFWIILLTGKWLLMLFEPIAHAA